MRIDICIINAGNRALHKCKTIKIKHLLVKWNNIYMNWIYYVTQFHDKPSCNNMEEMKRLKNTIFLENCFESVC